MDAIAFLDKESKSRLQPIYVLVGEEDFLKCRVMDKLVPMVLGESNPEFALANYPGEKADFSTIRNELDTLPFLSERRLVVVDQADVFVKNFRLQLEGYFAKPSEKGILILDVKTWMATTKLAKALPESATIFCKSPSTAKLVEWASTWTRTAYEKTLSRPAAQLLVDSVGSSMGVLDQEIQKLVVFVGEKSTIPPEVVDQLVCKSSQENVFKILDAMGESRSGDAMRILRERLEEGEEPLKILGALGHSLRRLVHVAREYQLDKNLDEAMNRVAIPNYPPVREATRKQLKHLGQSRIDQIFGWLVEADLDLKGNSTLPEELILERLILNLARSNREVKR